MVYVVYILAFLALAGWGLLLRVLYYYGQHPRLANGNKTATSQKETPLTGYERELAAIHEAGHAVVACFVGRRPVSVSISPATSGIAATLFSPWGQRIRTRKTIRGDIAILSAGRMAEESLRKITTSSCIHDLRTANQIAREAVIKLGMGKRTGLCSYEDLDDKLALLSESARKDIEDDIKDELAASAKIAMQILDSHGDLVEKLAETLLQNETLTGPALESVLPAGGQPHPVV